MKTVFGINGVVIGHATAHQPGVTVSCALEGADRFEVDNDSQVDNGWTYVTVMDGDVEVPTFSPPASPARSTPTPPQFLLLFTSAERVALRAARAADPVLQDFFALIEDPRLHDVDLNLKSVQDAVMYLLSATRLHDDGGLALRHAQVISNTPQ